MQLVKYDAARKALAVARTVDEVKKIRDFNKAVAAYARQAGDKQMLSDATEIAWRAERRLGEMLKAQKALPKEKGGGLNRGARGAGRPKLGPTKKEGPKDTTPTLAELGVSWKLSHRAQKIAAVPEKEFEAEIADWRERVFIEKERVTTNLVRREENQRREVALKKTPKPLPIGKYEVLYGDPPWRYEHVKTESRAIENQYPTMALDEIRGLKVPAADDCVLFLWATSPKVAEAISVIDAWGFSYRTCAVWVKDKIGMGYYFRQQHELLLVATKGSPGTPEPSERCSSVIQAPRGRHSEKPSEIYDLIESLYPEGRRCELWARSEREGWDRWGYEA